MRVVHAVGWYFPQPIGGTEVYVACLARELRQSGVDVRIAAPAAGATRIELYEHEGVPVFRYPIPAMPSRAEVRGETVVRGAEAFHEWLSVTRPDVLHAHTFVTGLGVLELERARAVGARVFVTSHSSALGYVCLRGTLRRWGAEICDGHAQPRICGACALEQRGVHRRVAAGVAAMPLPVARLANRVDSDLGTAVGLPAYIEQRMVQQRRVFNSIERFFALTTAAQTILVANGAPAAKVHINRLGVDNHQVASGPSAARLPSTPVIVGYLGRLDPIKGIEDLINAFTSLPREIPVRLDVRGSGDDPDARRLRAFCAAAAQRDSRITVGDPVPRNEVTAVLEGWHAVCCPGLSLEGGPTVALEAFAVRTPVIGSRFGGLAELVTDGRNGRLVTPGDRRELATVIRQIAERPEVVNEWRRNIPTVRSMRDVAADYLAAYQA